MKILCVVLTTTSELLGLEQYLHQQDFDVVVIDYTSEKGKSPARENVKLVFENPNGYKYQNIKLLFEEINLIDNYEYFWFPDWDIEIDSESVLKLVDKAKIFTLSLAQPSLSNDSFISWDITRHNPSTDVRLTNFVEVMCPLFTSEFLKEVLWTFSLNYSSWGLDFLWASLSGNRYLGIVDSVIVKHSRSISSHEWKLPNGKNANEELEELKKNYNLILTPQVIKVLI